MWTQILFLPHCNKLHSTKLGGAGARRSEGIRLSRRAFSVAFVGGIDVNGKNVIFRWVCLAH